MKGNSLSAWIGIGISALSLGAAAPASSSPLIYNVVIGESNAFLSFGISAAMDVNPDLLNLFPVGGAMTGQDNTTPTNQSRVTADVGYPSFNNGANPITFSELSIKFANAPGVFTGFAAVSVPIPLEPVPTTVLFSARMSTFQILLEPPLSSPLVPTGTNQWAWGGLANMRLVGILEPTVNIPGQDPVTLGAFPFEQAVSIPLAGTFSLLPVTGSEVTVSIPLDTLSNLDLSLPEINEQLDLLGLGLVTGFFHLENLTLADLATSVVYRNATFIPEPSPALLVSLGLVGLTMVRRRR